VRRWEGSAKSECENQPGQGEAPGRRLPFRARAAPSAKKPRASCWDRESPFCRANVSKNIFRGVKEGRAAGSGWCPSRIRWPGRCHENYDHLVNFELPIVAETNIRIVHNLIALKGVPFSGIKRVFSHPVALNQCLNFFARNPRIERIPFYDTAGSVKMIAEGEADGRRRDRFLGGRGRFMAPAFSADPLKTTAGILPGSFFSETPEYARRHPIRVDRRAAWKTSLVFSTRNVPGSLFRALSAFALRGPESDQDRVAPAAGKTVGISFLSRFPGRADSPNAQNALNHLRELADFLRVLGCYPKGA